MERSEPQEEETMNIAVSPKIKTEYEEELLKCMNSMYNLAYRMTLNKDDAADLVQDASMRGFRYFHRYERGTNFKAWILTILRNIFINQYRKKVKEPVKLNYDEIEGFVGTPETHGAADEIFGEHVQRAIDKLPEEMRTVITLFYVDGLAYKEIAEVLKCPIGTVMSRLHIAKKSLKKHYMQFVNEEAKQDG